MEDIIAEYVVVVQIMVSNFTNTYYDVVTFCWNKVKINELFSPSPIELPKPNLIQCE